MDKVSIVIPVYNAEKYVEKCINSIFNNTYKNFEVILINDGSTDNSLEVLNKFSKNKKIKIYTQDNHGAAYSRNFGLKKAMGKYITFMDSDDYIESDYLEKYVLAFKENIDIVLGGYVKVMPKKRKKSIPKFCDWDVFRFSVTFGKMYRKDFLDKYSIQFGNTEFLEDVIFNVTCLFNGARYQYIDYAGYNYVYNSNSISNSYGRHPAQITNIFKTIQYIDKLAHELNYNNSRYLINYYINAYLFMVFICCKKADYNFLKSNVNQFMMWLNNEYPGWSKEVNKVKEVDLLNKIVIFLWKGAYNIKLSNLLLLLYSKL